VCDSLHECDRRGDFIPRTLKIADTMAPAMSGRTRQFRWDFFSIQPSASFSVMRVNAISGTSRNVYKKRGVVFVTTDQMADLPNFYHLLNGMPRRAATQPFTKYLMKLESALTEVRSVCSYSFGSVCSVPTERNSHEANPSLKGEGGPCQRDG
jgi:hypothetical protein